MAEDSSQTVDAARPPNERLGRRISSGIVVSPGGLISLGPDDTRLYLNKIQWAASGRELLFFEIAFSDSSKGPSKDTNKDTRKP